MNDAGPLGSEGDARVDNNDDSHGRRCAVHTGHAEVNNEQRFEVQTVGICRLM